MKQLKIHKIPFKNVIFLAIECKMYLQIQQKLRCLGCISLNRPCAQPWRKQGSEFLEGWFLDKKLPFLHKKNTEHYFEPSLTIFFFQRWNFNLEMRWNSRMVIGRQPFCWKWLSFSKVSNMVKVNIHEHWARVTRFNPLWVSDTIACYRFIDSYVTVVLYDNCVFFLRNGETGNKKRATCLATFLQNEMNVYL